MKRKLLAGLLCFLTVFSCSSCEGFDTLKGMFGFSDSEIKQTELQYEVKKTETGDVVLYVKKADGECTLKELMDVAVKEENLEYEISGGLITSINGKANTANSYWMLYTSDTEMSNTEWGTYEYDGKTLSSAIFGAESLPTVQGEYYVWAYTTF